MRSYSIHRRLWFALKKKIECQTKTATPASGPLTHRELPGNTPIDAKHVASTRPPRGKTDIQRGTPRRWRQLCAGRPQLIALSESLCARFHYCIRTLHPPPEENTLNPPCRPLRPSRSQRPPPTPRPPPSTAPRPKPTPRTRWRSPRPPCPRRLKPRPPRRRRRAPRPARRAPPPRTPPCTRRTRPPTTPTRRRKR